MMPSSLLFVIFSVLLRITEGIGSASYFTSSFTLATVMYPKSVGMVMVSLLTFTMTSKLSCVTLYIL